MAAACLLASRTYHRVVRSRAIGTEAGSGFACGSDQHFAYQLPAHDEQPAWRADSGRGLPGSHDYPGIGWEQMSSYANAEAGATVSLPRLSDQVVIGPQEYISGKPMRL